MEQWLKEARKAVYEKAQQTMEELHDLADREHLQFDWVFERFMVEMRGAYGDEQRE